MELTRELLLQRKAEIMADFHAMSGALQQIDWSLEVLDKEEEPPGEAVDS